MQTLDYLNKLGEDLTVEDAIKILEAEHQVHAKPHDDGRVILDYDHISADKNSEIARECRGLVLRGQNLLPTCNRRSYWTFVARGFRRFFNAGEHRVDDNIFNWDMPVIGSHKEDGSLILLYNWQGQWCVNTRFSYADHPIDGTNTTWNNLFFSALNVNKQYLDFFLNKNYTYIFELCTQANRIVRFYEKPQAFLLSVFDGMQELSYEAVQDIAKQEGFQTPDHFYLKDIFEATHYLTNVVIKDPTFEGLVVRDCFNNRLKIKSELYLKLHKQVTRGKFDTQDYLSIYLDGKGSEFLQYFPDMQEEVNKIGVKFEELRIKIRDDFSDISAKSNSQKEFALQALRTPYSHVLFQMRKGVRFDKVVSENIERVAELLN